MPAAKTGPPDPVGQCEHLVRLRDVTFPDVFNTQATIPSGIQWRGSASN